MYADETVIYIAGKNIQSIESALKKELESISRYFNNNQLVINMNIGKTEVMLFGTPKRIATQPRSLQVKYKNQLIHNTNSYTYLGHIYLIKT